jgi:hypothetical protein
MVTVLECNIEECSCALRFFLWTKVLSAKDIYKEMLPVHDEKFLSLKAVHNYWVEKLSGTFDSRR